MIQKGSGDFEILADNEIVVTGRMTFPNAADKFMIDPIPVEITKSNVEISASDIYNEFQHRGHRYSGSYKAIKSITLCEEGSVAVAQYNSNWALFLEAMIQQHLLQDGEKTQEIFVPKNILKVAINQEQLPTEKSDLKINYDYATGLMSSEGIQLVGFRAIPYAREPKQISFDSIEFTPFSNLSFSVYCIQQV